MSKKGLAPVPGLHRVVKKDLPLAVKVTGRHLGGVAYLVSLAAERGGSAAGVSAMFNRDGSLEGVYIASEKGDVWVNPGDYVYLMPSDTEISVSNAETYEAQFRALQSL